MRRALGDPRLLLALAAVLAAVAMTSGGSGGGSSRSDSPNVVTFHTDPPGLAVWLWQADSTEPEYLGPSETALTLPRRIGQPARVKFGYGNWLSESYPLPEDALRKQRFPSDLPAQPVPLPTGLRLRHLLRHGGLWLAALGLALAGGGQMAVARRRDRLREKKRAEVLESLQAASEANNDPLLGSTVGEWRLARPLGAGGMASVYLAVPNATLDESQAVAIKVIHRQHAGSEDFRERFRREVQVSSALRHRNIMTVYDAGDESGLLYMAMELVEGSTLRDEIRPEGLPPARVLELLGPVMEALAYAHEQGVVHRDLKPENIMLTRAGRPVVMDFGLARRQDFQTMTATGSILGTPAYISPEQVGGQASGGSSDQYALGIMLYELCAGVTPYGHINDPIQVILSHFNGTPQPLGERCPDLPPALGQSVMRMLAKAPHQRFPDLLEALRELRASLGASP